MSAISLKSITGITSITTPTGVDNQLTLHTNDTTQRVKVTQSGIEVVGVATFQDIDVDGHTNLDNVSVAGVSTFSGGELVLNKQGALNAIEIGKGQNSNQYAYIDLIGDTTYSDFGFRIMRENAGANAESKLQHRGTGDFVISSADSSSLSFETGGSERLRITPS